VAFVAGAEISNLMQSLFRASRIDWLFLVALVWTLFLAAAMIYIMFAH
jgi:hypothetical protein